MSDFYARLIADPRKAIDAASVTRVDELGNGYDDFGQLIAPNYVAPEQTWGETALGVATAPARIATALAGSVSPYGAEGWQVPPIVNEGVDALTAVGDAYSGKMAPEDINSRALGMAGFMMGGGGIAAGRGAMVAANASKEASVPAILAGQETAPVTAYRGVRHGDMHGPINANNQYWMTDSPELASAYAMDENLPYQAPAVLPVNPDFKNPLTVDAAFAPWDKVPFEGGTMNTNAIAETAAGRGYDGVVFNNVIDAPSDLNPWAKPSSVYAAIKPNTVRSATTGEILYSNADNSASVPAIAGALDMSKEARLARAREMGFDTDNVMYHGTRKADGVFDEFIPSPFGSLGEGVYMTKDAGMASSYAVPTGKVYPTYVRGNMMPWDEYKGLERSRPGESVSQSQQRINDEIRSRGYAGVQYDDYGTVAVLDPRNIRSVNAAFDPAKSDSANLLAANADSRPALLAGMAGQEQIDPERLKAVIRARLRGEQ